MRGRRHDGDEADVVAVEGLAADREVPGRELEGQVGRDRRDRGVDRGSAVDHRVRRPPARLHLRVVDDGRAGEARLDHARLHGDRAIGEIVAERAAHEGRRTLREELLRRHVGAGGCRGARVARGRGRGVGVVRAGGEGEQDEATHARDRTGSLARFARDVDRLRSRVHGRSPRAPGCCQGSHVTWPSLADRTGVPARPRDRR